MNNLRFQVSYSLTLGLALSVSFSTQATAASGNEAIVRRAINQFARDARRLPQDSSFRQSPNEIRTMAKKTRNLPLNGLPNFATTLRAQFHSNLSNQPQRLSRTIELPKDGLPVDLDLSSKQKQYLLPNLNGTITIKSGNRDLIVDGNTRLTAAQVSAVHQILVQGDQSIDLSRKGFADGGHLELPSGLVQLTSLIIPKGVTVSGTIESPLRVSGNLTNAGNLLLDTTVGSVDLTANYIKNLRSGVLGTPEENGNNLDFDLSAADSIVNHGTIRSSGNLTLSAGNSIANTLQPGAPESSLPAVSAGGDLRVNSQSIVNHGRMGATTGNIYLADAIKTPLISIEAKGGRFEAANAEIVIGNNHQSPNESIILDGGDYHSRKLVINAGEGTADGIIGDVTGELKVSAGLAHIGVSTDNLNLGRSVITGDPTFFNDSGNITIMADLDFGEAIAILASGDITDNAVARSISARTIAGLGQQISIIAGATLTPSDGAVGNPIAIPNNEISQGFVKASKPSATGGSVLLGASTVSSSGLTNMSGADVTIIALASKDGNGGSVSVGGISAGGNGTGNNGNITVLAGGTSATAIVTQSVTSQGGSGNPGNILMQNAQPKVSMTFDSTGIGVGKIKTSKKLVSGGTVTREVSAPGGNITIQTGGLATVSSTGQFTSVNATVPGGSAGSISITGGSINVEGPLRADGANGLSGVGSGAEGGAGGDGGSITLNAITGGITVSGTADILSRGGAGGNGAAGATFGASGGAGGSGGTAGNIALNADQAILISTGPITSGGGIGGFGGPGASGSDGPTGGNGGAGGNGGGSGSGGNISLVSNSGDINVNIPLISSTAGSSGFGGFGGDGGNGTVGNNGDAGAGGDGGLAGGGGNIELITGGLGDITINGLTTTGATGGAGFAGGSASASAGVTGGGRGGDGGNGASGGRGGNILVQSEEGNIVINSSGIVSSTAGNGGSGGFGGSGGDATGGPGGDGGHGGDSGPGGDAGTVTLITTSKKTGSITAGGTTIIATLAGLGSLSGFGASGGDGTGFSVGSRGGDAGDVSATGVNGEILISSTSITATGMILAHHTLGPGGIALGGGSGGMSGTGRGGDGGNGGNGGLVTNGGTITIRAQNNAELGTLNASATATGVVGGFGGAGSSSLSADSSGGNGGRGGDGGAAGSGGIIDIQTNSFTALNLRAEGSLTGGNAGGGGIGANSGASGDSGGRGGDGGNGGAGGAGGIIWLSSKKGAHTAVNVSAVGSFFAGNGGSGGTTGSSGLDAVSGTDGSSGGAGGMGGDGGQVIAKSGSDAAYFSITTTGSRGGLGANGGDGSNTASLTAGDGGTAGSGGNSGNGGLVSINAKGAIAVTLMDVSGAFGSAGGVAGNGGTGSTSGGNAGLAGSAGRGGQGGEVKMKTKGNVSGGSILANGGTGFIAGSGGNGGSSSSSPGGARDGGAGAAAVLGAAGGQISISGQQVNLTGNISVNGGTGGTGGIGGNGGNGTIAVVGGDGAAGMAGAAGGLGGEITIKSKGTISAAAVTATGGIGGFGGGGGDGGDGNTFGGAGVSGGIGGDGGAAGTISLKSKASTTIAGTFNADGGAGGTGGNGGDGGTGPSVGAGGDGGDGGDGSDGGKVSVSNNAGTNPTASGGIGGAGGAFGAGDPPGSTGGAGTNGNDGTVSF